MFDRNDPFESMNRMFEQMRRDAFGGEPAEGRSFYGEASEWPIRMEGTDDGHLVIADLPGFEKSEIDLHFDDGVLTIEGVHEVEGDYEHRSRRVYERVRVPDAVDAEAISATYSNGVLEVVLPTDESAEDDHRIQIE